MRGSRPYPRLRAAGHCCCPWESCQLGNHLTLSSPRAIKFPLTETLLWIIENHLPAVPLLWFSPPCFTVRSGQFALQCHRQERISFKNMWYLQVAKIVIALRYLASTYYTHRTASSRLWGFMAPISKHGTRKLELWLIWNPMITKIFKRLISRSTL